MRSLLLHSHFCVTHRSLNSQTKNPLIWVLFTSGQLSLHSFSRERKPLQSWTKVKFGNFLICNCKIGAVPVFKSFSGTFLVGALHWQPQTRELEKGQFLRCSGDLIFMGTDIAVLGRQLPFVGMDFRFGEKMPFSRRFFRYVNYFSLLTPKFGYPHDTILVLRKYGAVRVKIIATCYIQQVTYQVGKKVLKKLTRKGLVSSWLYLSFQKVNFDAVFDDVFASLFPIKTCSLF